MATINTAVLDTIIVLAGLKTRPVEVSKILAKRKDELSKLLPDWKGAESSGIFAENFFPDRSINHRRNETDYVFRKAGKIESVSEFIAENQLRGYFLLNGQNGKVKVYFTLSPEHDALIQQLDVTYLE